MTDKPTVLVVEDEVELAELYATWLQQAYEVRTANTAADALDQFDDEVDVVLLDRRLPEMSGDEFLERIRERGFDTPVAMVSAVDPDFDILEMGFDAYLVKPVTRDDLDDVVDRLLARRLYDDEVSEYFSLAAKRAALESEKSTRELESNDAYIELCERLDDLRSDLDDLVDSLDADDMAALFHALEDGEGQ
ncbi:HalX domain-containing protein [Halocalculus aciditolerans]|uniref:DNA-binding protein n=1 Tax=Halocalculus aciditolerans TaxID=1383812 RepID=A0A830F9T3_9EURY|nr:HalX domain-containing protein [Halocalculus aciditolerans]GGL54092.1 DNA-binding protein [Halocalculus aciditolerans]